MKNLITTIAIVIILVLLGCINCDAKGKVIVSSQGRTIVLSQADINKVNASHNQFSIRALANISNGGTLRNNDAADFIINYLKK